MSENKNILLYPLSLIYGIITWIRNFLYNSGIFSTTEFELPVICVGNITAGGTGKTPHTEYLAGLLKTHFRVTILSRGYLRKSRGFRIASSASTVKEIGDEPMQIFRKFPDICVTVDRNRPNGVNEILKQIPETEVVILDDGFQHRRITPGFSILLTDFNRLMIKDQLLPYGRLRETVSNMRRADIILVTKSPENISPIERRIIVKEINKAPYQNLYFTSFHYSDPVPVFGVSPGISEMSLSEKGKTGRRLVLVTGIVNPTQLKEYLNPFFSEIVHFCFPDHHRFSEKDILKILEGFSKLEADEKYIFTTEKDAARLREFTNFAEPIRSLFYYMPVEVHFLNDDKMEFDNQIINYVRKNKRNNRISESPGLQRS